MIDLLKLGVSLLWILLWDIIFAICILPWAWIPWVTGAWDPDEYGYDRTPRWIRWVVDQATGNF